jgi:hypothetical protein
MPPVSGRCRCGHLRPEWALDALVVQTTSQLSNAFRAELEALLPGEATAWPAVFGRVGRGSAPA